MNKPLWLILIASVLVPFASCSGDDEHTKTPSDASHRKGSGHSLRLDNGKKWKANKATHVGMGNMQKLVAEFQASDTKDYRKLGESLQAETNTIIRKCTMTGEPHDQLHLVLNPMLGLVNKLVTGEGGSSEVEALEKHLRDYHSHFEA